MSPGMSKYGHLYADFHETNAPYYVNKSYKEFQPNWTINMVGVHTNSYVSKGRVWLLHSWFSWISEMLNGITWTSSMPYFIQVRQKVENVQKFPWARKEVRFCASIFMKLVNCSTALRVHLPYRIFPQAERKCWTQRQNLTHSRQHGFHCTDFHETRNFSTTLRMIYHTQFHKFSHEIWQLQVQSIYSTK